MENENMNVAQEVLLKYLRGYAPVHNSQICGGLSVESGENDCLTGNVYGLTDSSTQGRVVVKTTEDIIRELEDIVEIETNDVVAVMLAEGYDLMRRNEVFGWAMRSNGEHCV